MYGEFLAIARTAVNIMAELWWFVVVAIMIASVMSTLKLDKKVAEFLRRSSTWAVLGALLLGLVSPL